MKALSIIDSQSIIIYFAGWLDIPGCAALARPREGRGRSMAESMAVPASRTAKMEGTYYVESSTDLWEDTGSVAAPIDDASINDDMPLNNAPVGAIPPTPNADMTAEAPPSTEDPQRRPSYVPPVVKLPVLHEVITAGMCLAGQLTGKPELTEKAIEDWKDESVIGSGFHAASSYVQGDTDSAAEFAKGFGRATGQIGRAHV